MPRLTTMCRKIGAPMMAMTTPSGSSAGRNSMRAHDVAPAAPASPPAARWPAARRDDRVRRAGARGAGRRCRRSRPRRRPQRPRRRRPPWRGRSARLVCSTSMPRWKASASPSSRPLSARISRGSDEHDQQREGQRSASTLGQLAPDRLPSIHSVRSRSSRSSLAKAMRPISARAERAERDAGEQQRAGRELALPRRRSRPARRWWRCRRRRLRPAAHRRRTPWPRARQGRCPARWSPPPRARRRRRRRPGPGSASGLRNMPCIMAPDTASAAPTKAPSSRRGRRMSSEHELLAGDRGVGVAA